MIDLHNLARIRYGRVVICGGQPLPRVRVALLLVAVRESAVCLVISLVSSSFLSTTLRAPPHRHTLFSPS